MRVKERFTVDGLSDVLVDYAKKFSDPVFATFSNPAFIVIYSASGAGMGVRCVDETYRKLRETGKQVWLINVKLDSLSTNDLMRVVESLDRDPDVTNILCLEGLETAEVSLKRKIYDIVFDRIYNPTLEKSDVPKNCVVFLPIQKDFISSITNMVRNRMTLFEL